MSDLIAAGLVAVIAFVLGWMQGSLHELQEHNAWMEDHLAWLRRLFEDDDDGDAP